MPCSGTSARRLAAPHPPTATSAKTHLAKPLLARYSATKDLRDNPRHPTRGGSEGRRTHRVASAPCNEDTRGRLQDPEEGLGQLDRPWAVRGRPRPRRPTLPRVRATEAGKVPVPLGHAVRGLPWPG